MILGMRVFFFFFFFFFFLAFVSPRRFDKIHSHRGTLPLILPQLVSQESLGKEKDSLSNDVNPSFSYFYYCRGCKDQLQTPDEVVVYNPNACIPTNYTKKEFYLVPKE